MKKLLLASLGLIAVTAVSAPAADAPPPRMPTPRAAPSYVPFFSWNGLYLGINAGYGWGKSSWDSPTAATGDFNVNGPFVGGTFGYNVQTGSFVFGLEGDIDWSGIKGTTTTNCAAGCETRNNWLGTFRGRVGYALDRWLPYLTGGMAFGDIKATTPGSPGASKTKIGWTLGGGVEYAFMGNWSAKAEYLYVDLGKFDCGTSCGATAPDEIKFNAHLLRFGLNYKF